jgi:dTDP-4-amino-4,6-dideoxygalactose transaminase
MKVPALDLRAQFLQVEGDVRAAIERVLRTQQFILGPECEHLEREIAAYSNCEAAIGVSSGSDALLVALMALGIGPGDDVITSPFTFVATAMAVARLGARAVFVDIDPTTYAIDENRVEAAISSRTRAILPVHLFGQMAHMKALRTIASRHDLPVIEDAAQAIGAKRENANVGTGSCAATLSFFPSKNLGCMGDGGMVLTNDLEFASRIRLLRNQGQRPKYTSQLIGGNFRLDDIQAAILRAKLPYLDGWTAARQQHALTYRVAFEEKHLDPADLSLPTELSDVRHVYNQFVIRTRHRDALWEHLKRNDISCAVYYPVPLHLQPCFASWGYRANDFPESERAAHETLALPLYPELDESAIRHVVDIIASFFSERNA